MSKRKLRFNGIDALIILVIAAAVFVLLYVFVFMKSLLAEKGMPSAQAEALSV